jgi:hypothetical protein
MCTVFIGTSFKTPVAATTPHVPAQTRVTVEFNAVEKREVAGKVSLEVMDASELLGVASTTPLVVKGEAYRIERDIKFPQVGTQPDHHVLARVLSCKDFAKHSFFAHHQNRQQ